MTLAGSLYDIIGSVIHLAIWINVECNIGIVCTCLPVMRTLLQRLDPVIFHSRVSRSRGGSTGQKGSQRLTDDEENSRISQKKTVTSTIEGVGMPLESLERRFSRHHTWLPGKRSNKIDTETTGSMEEMVPVGNITVQHDIEWVNAAIDKPQSDSR